MLRKAATEDDNDIEDLVFLSPEESFPEKSPAKDQGASPVLRCSNRKRKSTSASVTDMTKGSGTKKKKTSPAKENDPGKYMAKIRRFPQQSHEGQGQDPMPKEPAAGFEALLQAMEGRLAAKLESQ